jgi:hypothetical protein
VPATVLTVSNNIHPIILRIRGCLSGNQKIMPRCQKYRMSCSMEFNLVSFTRFILNYYKKQVEKVNSLKYKPLKLIIHQGSSQVKESISLLFFLNTLYLLINTTTVRWKKNAIEIYRYFLFYVNMS